MGVRPLQVTVSSSSVTDQSPQNLVSVFSFGCVSQVMHVISVKTLKWCCFVTPEGSVLLGWFIWQLYLCTAYSLISNVPHLTAFKFMWHVALPCLAGENVLLTFPLFSYYHEMVQNVSQLTHRMCVMRQCVVLPVFAVHCTCNFGDMMENIILLWKSIWFLILAPIIQPFPVDINHVKYYINIVEINTNYVFLSEYSNWTADSTCWRESVYVWRV